MENQNDVLLEVEMVKARMPNEWSGSLPTLLKVSATLERKSTVNGFKHHQNGFPFRCSFLVFSLPTFVENNQSTS